MPRRSTLVLGLLLALGGAGGLAFATGHLARTVAVQIDLDGVGVARCAAARASALGEGGLLLSCDESPMPWSLYVIYDSRQRKDGTINALNFSRPSREQWAADPALASSFPEALLGDLKPAVDRLDCPSALALDRKTGEAPLPQNWFGAPLPGVYVIELASPCGRLTVEIGKPWAAGASTP